MKITRLGRALIKKAVSEMNETIKSFRPEKLTVLEVARALQVKEVQSAILKLVFVFRAADEDGIAALRDSGIDQDQISIFEEVKIK